MKIKKRRPANETPCSICGAKKRLTEIGVTRDVDGKGRKYDQWRCNICDYPVYVPHKKEA